MKKKNTKMAEGGQLDNLLGLIGPAATILGGPIGGAAASMVGPLLKAFGVGTGKNAMRDARNQDTLAANSQFYDGGDPKTRQQVPGFLQTGPFSVTGPQQPPGLGIINSEPLERARQQFLQQQRPGIIDSSKLEASRNQFIQNQQAPTTAQTASPAQSTQTTPANTGPVGQKPFDVDAYNKQLQYLEQKTALSEFLPKQQIDNGLPAAASGAEGGDGKDGKFNLNNALRYAPVLGNAASLLFGDNKPEVASLDRLNDRYQPNFLDTNSVLNPVRAASRNMQNAIIGNSGGSGNTAISGLLGQQVNNVDAISNAMFGMTDRNDQKRTLGQEFNNRNNQFNISQSNQENEINRANRGAARARKDALWSTLFEDVGNIGREGMLNDILKNTTGYGQTGQYQEDNQGGNFGFMGQLFNSFKKANPAPNGDTSNQYGGPTNLTKFIKERYGY
jgi:hypothetical protein